PAGDPEGGDRCAEEREDVVPEEREQREGQRRGDYRLVDHPPPELLRVPLREGDEEHRSAQRVHNREDRDERSNGEREEFPGHGRPSNTTIYMNLSSAFRAVVMYPVCPRGAKAGRLHVSCTSSSRSRISTVRASTNGRVRSASTVWRTCSVFGRNVVIEPPMR